MSRRDNTGGFPEFEKRLKEIYAEYSAGFPAAVNQPTAAIYLRASTVEIGALESQLHTALGYAVKAGVPVKCEHIYFDYATGIHDDRPGLQTLQQLLDWGTVKIVIVVSLNRLYRKNDPLKEFLETYEGKHAVRFLQVNSDPASTSSAKREVFVDEQQASFIRKIYNMFLGGMLLDAIVASLNAATG